MRHLLFNLRNKAETILQNNLATRDRPLGFQIAVATLFAVDVLAFIAFCIIKIVSGWHEPRLLLLLSFIMSVVVEYVEVEKKASRHVGTLDIIN